MSARKPAHSIRVNLRFGPRTDPALIREIATLPPYKRAKLLRRLLEVGWRSRSEPLSPASTYASVAVTQAHAVDANDGSFSQDVLALVGKSVRL